MAQKKGSWGGRREGAGRPSVLKDPVDRWVRIERRDAEAAEKHARAQGLSFSALMRKALGRYLGYLERRKRK